MLILICFGSYLMPTIIALASRLESHAPLTPAFLFSVTLFSAAAIAISAVSRRLLKGVEPYLARNAAEQVRFLEALDPRWIDAAIVAAAALSLFLELAMIRWQASVFEFFAFYKNFGLLACFVGLGLGYALSSSIHIPLLLVLPCMALQFGVMTTIRYGFGTVFQSPFREQLNMGWDAGSLWQAGALYVLLAVIFVNTALIFIPIGQLCGRLMERRVKLKAYGLNLIGSLIGVAAMLLVSFLWAPPMIWFALTFVVILLFSVRTPASLLTGAAFALLCVVILAWPINPLWQRIYSPYQVLELGHSDDTGLMLIRAAGHYYQRAYNLSGSNTDPKARSVRTYYDFPYKAHPDLANVAIVGAGTGNDVAAALRAGARSVEAIEIDPAILMAGKANHPEKPYSDARVNTVVNDARSFFRTTANSYDMVVYGLLDSHTLLSQGSSVRLDSFVYTIEGLREARARLKPGGVMSLSFTVLSEGLGRKIYLMLQKVFDGRAPICVKAIYDGSIIFMESNDSQWKLDPSVPAAGGFADDSTHFANPALEADMSTDDWPFFYMPRRVYPVSYLVMICQILLLSVFVTRSFLVEKPQLTYLSFLLLGAGFMLVETKAITELGLTFGNTWQVIGIVIAGILTMAFLANLTVQWLGIRKPLVPYLFLWGSLALGWAIAGQGGFPSTTAGRLEAAIVLTCPMFFSGMVFSSLLGSKGNVSTIMAMNLVGAVCGGLTEYNSMYFGFRFLYLVAMAFYVLAFVADLLFQPREADAAAHQSLVANHG